MVYKYINVETKKVEKIEFKNYQNLYENCELLRVGRQWNAFTYEVFSENGKLVRRLYHRINHNAYLNLSANYNTFGIITKEGKTYQSCNWLHLIYTWLRSIYYDNIPASVIENLKRQSLNLERDAQKKLVYTTHEHWKTLSTENKRKVVIISINNRSGVLPKINDVRLFVSGPIYKQDTEAS